jgi:hypothetical protein
MLGAAMDFVVCPDLQGHENENAMGARPHGHRIVDGRARHVGGVDRADDDPQ